MSRGGEIVIDIPGFRGETRRNEPLSRHTSYGIGGPVDLFAVPADRADLELLLRELGARSVPFFVLGGGTNLLVRDGGFRGAAVSLARMKAVRVEREYHALGGHFAVFSAEAGAALAALLGFVVEQGYTGFEFATGIPGTVGGAVRMNAGTAAGELGDVIDAVTLLSPRGETVVRGREEMGFGYRTSDIPPGHVVTMVSVVLRRGDKERVRAAVRALVEERKARQPWGLPNAGSVFKNPIGMAAGKLIEEAGMKGRSVGGAQVSERHANFIVNRGGATAADVLALMEQVKRAVHEKHGIAFEPEIRIIGED